MSTTNLRNFIGFIGKAAKHGGSAVPSTTPDPDPHSASAPRTTKFRMAAAWPPRRR